MSAGFPNRPRRSDFGPTYINARPTRDSTKNAKAEVFNLDVFQTAGLSAMSPLAWFCGTIIAGPDVELGAHAESWNPEGLTTGAYAPPQLTRTDVGVYAFEYPSQVPGDEQDESVLHALEFSWGLAVATERGSSGVALGFVELADAVSGEVRIAGASIPGPGTFDFAELSFAVALF